VDDVSPSGRLLTLLQEFHAKFPTVPVRLFVEALGGVERAVRSGSASIGVGNSLHMNMTGLRRIDIPGVHVTSPPPLIHLPRRTRLHHHAHETLSSLFSLSNLKGIIGTSALLVSPAGVSAP